MHKLFILLIFMLINKQRQESKFHIVVIIVNSYNSIQ